tara:strand:+ start:975 stop:1292 length:318 start_codon:yes stop_codon:yes gene_type:complete
MNTKHDVSLVGMHLGWLGDKCWAVKTIIECGSYSDAELIRGEIPRSIIRPIEDSTNYQVVLVFPIYRASDYKKFERVGKRIAELTGDPISSNSVLCELSSTLTAK